MSIELSLATSGALPRRQNAALKPQRPAPAANDELVQHEFSPLRQGSPAGHEKDFSAGALAVVVAAHVLTIAVLLYQASLQPVEMPQAEPAAIMVSLASNPAQEAEPEVLEVPPGWSSRSRWKHRCRRSRSGMRRRQLCPSPPLRL